MNLSKPAQILGERVILRAPANSDVQDRFAIGRHAEFVRMVGGDGSVITPMTLGEAEEWLAKLCAEHFAWVVEVEGKAIGSARLHGIDQDNRRASYAVGIFDPAWWGRGIGTEVTKLVLQYGFDTLGLHRIELRVLTDNLRAISAYQKCGFVQEGIERDTLFVEGVWKSDLVMSILEHEHYLKRPMR